MSANARLAGTTSAQLAQNIAKSAWWDLVDCLPGPFIAILVSRHHTKKYLNSEQKMGNCGGLRFLGSNMSIRCGVEADKKAGIEGWRVPGCGK